MNTEFRKKLPGTALDYYDVREAVDAIEPGAYAKLPYTSRVLAENLVRRCEPSELTDSLKQLIYRKNDLDFPWYPARVVCHDILGQTALVDLAGLRDAIADQDCQRIGFWSTAGYQFDKSKAVTPDGEWFVGLALDDENQYDLSDERLLRWASQLVSEINELG